MDHRHDPSFIDHLRSKSGWVVDHADGCLHQMLARYRGQYRCKCNVTTYISTQLRQSIFAVNNRLAFTCKCGEVNNCACPSRSANISAWIVDKGTVRSVADADTLVSEMSDPQAVAYKHVRDAFLKAEQVRHRDIESVRRAAADERTSRGGEVVYFLLSEDGKVKIGTSAHLEKRMEALQTASSTKLTLALTIPGGAELEAELHQFFKAYKLNGEWFCFSDEIRYFISGASFYKNRVG